MLFHVNHPVADPDALLRALRTHDAFAQIDVDATAAQVKVLGQLTAQQAAAAFRQVGLDASPLAESRAVHESGGSTCCGHCT